MVEIKGIAHFAIPVSNIDRSTRFYTEIVGCKYLGTLPNKSICFLDAGGVCVLLIQRDPPIVTRLEYSNGVHHAFIIEANSYRAALEHLRTNGVEIFFEENRQDGIINGPRAYFRDPDGTVLEYIDRTSYANFSR
jgi:catechol 2,3-dioxygenase-like lactoylglutathione lyase family enzyme